MKHVLIRSLLVVALLLGCSKSQNPERASPTAPQSVAKAVDPNTVGAVSGTISFKGAAPKMPMLDMSADPACPPEPQAPDVVVVKNGKLANVFVYLKDADRLGPFLAPSEPVVMDQKGCHYSPHVLGLMVGQPLKVLNTDIAEHNVHPMPK